MRAVTNILGLLLLSTCSSDLGPTNVYSLAEQVSHTCHVITSADLSKYASDILLLSDHKNEETYCQIFRDFQQIQEPQKKGLDLVSQLEGDIEYLNLMSTYKSSLSLVVTGTKLEADITADIEQQRSASIELIRSTFQTTEDINISNNLPDDHFLYNCNLTDNPLITNPSVINPSISETAICLVDKKNAIHRYREGVVRTAISNKTAPSYILTLGDLELELQNL